RTGGSGEWQYVADVADTGDVHDQALKAKAVTRMLGAAVFAQVEVPGVVLLVESQLADAVEQHVVTLLTLAAADDLADARHQQVGRRNGLVVVVDAHVEGLDLLRVVGDKDRLLKELLGQVALVLGLQVAAPVYR